MSREERYKVSPNHYAAGKEAPRRYRDDYSSGDEKDRSGRRSHPFQTSSRSGSRSSDSRSRSPSLSKRNGGSGDNERPSVASIYAKIAKRKNANSSRTTASRVIGSTTGSFKSRRRHYSQSSESDSDIGSKRRHAGKVTLGSLKRARQHNTAPAVKTDVANGATQVIKKSSDQNAIEDETQKRVEQEVQRRIEEELERRRPEIEAEIERRVAAMREQIENDVKRRLEKQYEQKMAAETAKLEEERKKREELDRIMEENKRRIQQQQQTLAKERLKDLERERKQREERERRQLSEIKSKKAQQDLLLGKHQSRSKLSFGFAKK